MARTKHKVRRARTARVASGVLPPKAMRRARRNRKRSSLEKLVYSWLEADKIEFKKEHPIGKCHVDILLSPRTVVELNGCHWHACGVCHKAITLAQQEIQVKDARRYAFFRSRGYDVITIWEHEIKDEPDRVRAMLRAISHNVKS